MNDILLDGRRMRTRDAAYDTLAKKLLLPAYFGRNADALYDCLSAPTPAFPGGARVTLCYAASMRRGLGAYADKILGALADAARDNERFAFRAFDGARPRAEGQGAGGA